MSARSAVAILMASVAALSLAGLSACGEKPQTAGQAGVKKADAAGYAGPQSGPYAAEGFKAGDKAGWESQLKARTERGQNEYGRTSDVKR